MHVNCYSGSRYSSPHQNQRGHCFSYISPFPLPLSLYSAILFFAVTNLLHSFLCFPYEIFIESKKLHALLSSHQLSTFHMTCYFLKKLTYQRTLQLLVKDSPFWKEVSDYKDEYDFLGFIYFKWP